MSRQLLRNCRDNIWTFYRKIVRKRGNNIWESASVEKFPRNLMKFWKNAKKFWKRFQECTEKVFRNVGSKQVVKKKQFAIIWTYTMIKHNTTLLLHSRIKNIWYMYRQIFLDADFKFLVWFCVNCFAKAHLKEDAPQGD